MSAYCVLVFYVDVIVFMWCVQMSDFHCKPISPQGQIYVLLDQSPNLNITEAVMMTENGTTGSKDIHAKY